MTILLIFLFCIIFIVVASTRFKVHPFLSLLAGAFLFGLLSGMPAEKIIDSVNTGFGGTTGNIGIIIVAGIIIGAFLENSGGAQTLAVHILKLTGKKRVHAAMGIIGYIVSIPVFADSGFVILSSLNRSITKKAGLSLAGTAIALSLGLTASHTMVPPTPGPIAAAGILEADLGRIILIGLSASIFGLLVCIPFSIHAGENVFVSPDLETDTETELKAHGYQPSVIRSLLPVIIPILLIVLRSLAGFPAYPFGEGQVQSLLLFIGHPVTALFIGVFISFFLPEKFSKEMLSTSGWVGNALKSAAIIILITGAGGAFGKVLQNSEIAELLGKHIRETGLGLWLPFAIAAAIKTAQGSSTVAIITAASIVAPLLPVMGLDSETSKAMAVIAIGSGAAVVSHANDSFFWVVTQMSSMNIKQGYRTHSLGTIVLGFSSMVFLSLLNSIL